MPESMRALQKIVVGAFFLERSGLLGPRAL